ncbi:serine/threonine protein kinase [[Emmonsia] crescens]|uniref:Serine/threonine protein kinase n=1 Tax=[Emmonsia] crescens TaxID=73230 RepID=A0A2B7Z6Y0_9EURO|nr:serine/threonine protein kinase [Emmonsia crescens]
MVLNEQKLPLRLTRADILGSGSASIVFAIGERIALKAPIIYKANIQLTDQQIEQSTDSIASLAREKGIYDLLNDHPHRNILQTILYCAEGIFVPRMSCTVDHWMQDDPKSIPAPLRLRWVKKLASAAEHLEIHGLVHGDIRPANTLLDNNMHIKLADFDSCVSTSEDCLAFTVPYHDAFEETASHTTEQFAIGSFMYTVFTGVEPEFEITGRKLWEERLPDTSGMLGGISLPAAGRRSRCPSRRWRRRLWSWDWSWSWMMSGISTGAKCGLWLGQIARIPLRG